MRSWQTHRAGRAIIGVVALYALLLQAFLGFATPSLARGPGGILCTEHGSSVPDGKSGAHQGHQCCLPVQNGSFVPPPDLSAEIAWSRPASYILAWRPESKILTIGPPARAHQPRGPPLA